MRTFATAVVAVGLALVASTPAFANRQGGLDTQNPVPHEAVAADGPQITVWGGEELDTRPTVSADALTGTSSQDVASYTVGRLTYRVVKVHESSTSTQVAKGGYFVFVNG
jgi:hypothetical protein